MKLGYVTASFPYGPGESFLMPELAALERLGVEIAVLPLFPRGRRRGDWAPSGTGVTAHVAGLLSGPVVARAAAASIEHPLATARQVERLARGGLRGAAKNLAVLPKALWLAAAIRHLGCEHVHVHWAGTTASAAMVAGALTGVPWSLTCHRWDIYEDNLLADKVTAARFTRFISERGRADALRLGVDRARTCVIPLGTEIPEIAPGPSWPGDGPFVVLCPANLVPVKGHRHLLAACALVRDAGVDVRLSLAGDGPLRAELQAEGDRLGLSDRVRFLGQVPHRELLGMYVRGVVHATALASVELDEREHEGVPVSLMEAMAHAVPVVATATGSIPELVPPSLGLTAPQRSPEGLASILVELARSRARYEAASRACRERVRSAWSVDGSARRLVALMGGERVDDPS